MVVISTPNHDGFVWAVSWVKVCWIVLLNHKLGVLYLE